MPTVCSYLKLCNHLSWSIEGLEFCRILICLLQTAPKASGRSMGLSVRASSLTNTVERIDSSVWIGTTSLVFCLLMQESCSVQFSTIQRRALGDHVSMHTLARLQFSLA